MARGDPNLVESLEVEEGDALGDGRPFLVGRTRLLEAATTRIRIVSQVVQLQQVVRDRLSAAPASAAGRGRRSGSAGA